MTLLFGQRVAVCRPTAFPTAHDKEFNRWGVDDREEPWRFGCDFGPASLVMGLGGLRRQSVFDSFRRYVCRVLVWKPVRPFSHNTARRFDRNHRIDVISYPLAEKPRTVQIPLGNDEPSVYCEGLNNVTVQFENVYTLLRRRDIAAVNPLKFKIKAGEDGLLADLIDTGLRARPKSEGRVSRHRAGFFSANTRYLPRPVQGASFDVPMPIRMGRLGTQ